MRHCSRNNSRALQGRNQAAAKRSYMEHTLVHLAATAAWLFFIMFVFAVIGVVATIRWIINVVTRGERAVVTGVEGVEQRITHRGP